MLEDGKRRRGGHHADNATRREPERNTARAAILLAGPHVEALEAFNGALALDDTICLTWVGKGKALLELPRISEAEAAFERALSLDSTNTEALHGRALARKPPRREQAGQVAADLSYAVTEALEVIAQLAQLGYHALMALLHC